MKIDDKMASMEISKYVSNSTPKTPENGDESKTSDQQKVESNTQTGQDAVVNFSQASREAQQINKIVASEPDVREEKVAALKAQVESETYEVDNDAVADKLVDSFVEETF